MFFIGTTGAAQDNYNLTMGSILAGVGIIAIIGWLALGWKLRSTTKPATLRRTPLAFDEKFLLVLIIIALIIRFLTTAYWPFTSYDPLWVFGYNARVFFLNGFIPQEIAYYPQYIPLQYTFAQLIAGNIDDHAARTVVFFMHVGSILAAYVAGKLLFNRRTGFFAAGLWALYPHVSEWARVGDLEIPLAFLMTVSMAFFLKAWLNPAGMYRRRYALIAGLIFGVAMWTKPTAGAFIWGVILLVLLDLLRVRFDLMQWRPRFEITFITGLACIPHGAIWYVRNLLLGHAAIDLPHVSWIFRARRSGDLFGWILLALILLLIFAHTRRHKPDIRFTLPGFLLIFAGVLPSTPALYEVFTFLPAFMRLDPPMSYMQPVEWLLLFSGVVLVLIGFRSYITQKSLSTKTRTILWAYALVLPYFITWFYSYSYHYRLVFAIVPILILPCALLLSELLPAATIKQQSAPVKFGYGLIIIVIALPGIMMSYLSADRYHDWLWTDRYPDDWSRYSVHNPDIMLLAERLHGHRHFTGEDPVVFAPGEQRLPFFFPELTIDNTSLPTQLDTLSDAGATHFVYGQQAEWRYTDAHILPEDNQVVAAMGRKNVMEQAILFEDGIFRYELYQLNLDKRFGDDARSGLYIPDEIVQYGDFARLHGFINILGNAQLKNNRAFFEFLWESLEPAGEDYEFQIRLVFVEDGETDEIWRRKIAEHAHGHYRTSLWQPGELILDEFAFQVQNHDAMRQGDYRIELHLCPIDPAKADNCAPITVDGAEVDYYALPITWRYD